jgi:hypothetical protein
LLDGTYFSADLSEFSGQSAPQIFASKSTRTGSDKDEFGNALLPKRLFYWRAIFLQLFVVSLLISFAGFARADKSDYLADQPQPKWLQLASLVENEKRPLLTADIKRATSSWALAFDNDLLAPGHRDRDYTYGMNLTYSGERAVDADISLKTTLVIIDSAIGVDSWVAKPRHNYSLEAGLFGFTPKELERKDINESDRPYASLVYFSSSHEQIDIEKNVAWNTTLTLGVLGLSFVGDLQNAAHQETAGENARGWNHQISDGGELTARYVIARQDYLDSFSDSVELKSTVQASVGYLTEASWGLSFRAGTIISPWASFNPDLISYGEKSTYSNNTSTTNEHYFWSGFTLKARFYNAFLQGQFRDSDFAYSYSGLRPLIAEAWAGYTYAFKQGYRASYVLRAQSSEIKHGDGDRNVVWGGLIFAKTI